MKNKLIIILVSLAAVAGIVGLVQARYWTRRAVPGNFGYGYDYLPNATGYADPQSMVNDMNRIMGTNYDVQTAIGLMNQVMGTNYDAKAMTDYMNGQIRNGRVANWMMGTGVYGGSYYGYPAMNQMMGWGPAYYPNGTNNGNPYYGRGMMGGWAY